MAEALRSEMQALLAAREQARAAFEAAVADAVARDLRLLDVYREARMRALVQPADDGLWQAANQARQEAAAAAQATNAALQEAAGVRDAAILAAARRFASQVPTE